MRKHGGTPSRRDKHVTLAAISPPGVARGRFVGGQQSGLAGSKPPPLFTREASSCSSQGRRQGEPWGASPRPSAPTYLPTWVLVHHSRLPAWPRSTSDDPYLGPYKIPSVDGHRITVRCSARLGGTLVCAAQHLKRYYDPEDLCGEEWELKDEEIIALDLQGAASRMEVEGELPDMNAEEIAKEGFYLVKSVLRHCYC